MPQVAYFDHAASSPTLPEVIDAVFAQLGEASANPSGTHRRARAARRRVDEARDTVAKVLGVEPGEVIWTSGGTEADNLAVFGAGALESNGQVVCSAIEHAAVLEPVRHLGGRTTAVDSRGLIDLDALASSLDEATRLVSVMAVNNEVGTIQPIEAVAGIVAARAPRAVFHVDAVQGLGWLDLSAVAALADAVSISAHKVGGPQGVGALWLRAGMGPAPRALGGGQERGRRSGTVPVALVAGATVAVELAARRRDETVARVRRLRDRLADGLLAAVDGVVETGVFDGDRAHKIAGNLHLCIDGVEGEALLYLLDEAGIAASAAAACSSGAAAPSHVLAAMGLVDGSRTAALRLSLGPSTTDSDVDRVLDVLPAAVARLRTMGS